MSTKLRFLIMLISRQTLNNNILHSNRLLGHRVPSTFRMLLTTFRIHGHHSQRITVPQQIIRRVILVVHLNKVRITRQFSRRNQTLQRAISRLLRDHRMRHPLHVIHIRRTNTMLPTTILTLLIRKRQISSLRRRRYRHPRTSLYQIGLSFRNLNHVNTTHTSLLMNQHLSNKLHVTSHNIHGTISILRMTLRAPRTATNRMYSLHNTITTLIISFIRTSRIAAP